jgi:hypothetical protein
MSQLHPMVVLALCGILCLSVTSASAQSSRKSKSDGPRIEIDPAEHDFGDVQQNQKLAHEFVVTNTGTEELEIRRLSTTCGCTAAITTDRRIPPGGSTKLQVTLETRRYKGVIERSVSIASNDPSRVHTVRLKAFVASSE